MSDSNALPVPEPKRPRLRLVEADEGSFANTRTKCTKKLTADFCELIEKGLPPDGCCDLLGISSASFWTWLRRGQTYNAAAEQSREDKDAPFGWFVSQFRLATAKYRLARVEALHRPGNKNWYRELAILERRDRPTFGRQEQGGGQSTDFDPDEQFL